MTPRGKDKRAAERLASDILPACPRCGDLCEPDADYCPECGCALREGETWK
jgi:uncharacterized OB-fold protein